MWYHPRPGMATHGAALIGMYVMLLGFGMLALDAAIGILLIPAGLLLAVFGHEHHRKPRPLMMDQRTVARDTDIVDNVDIVDVERVSRSDDGARVRTGAAVDA